MYNSSLKLQISLRTSRETLSLETFKPQDRDENDTFQNTSRDLLETETTSLASINYSIADYCFIGLL
jgi:hypothetical protein